jgi:nucleoside-diphosphate-sugar epimerase
MRVLVTGGTGLVGGAVCRCLVADGHLVTATCWQQTPDADGSVQWVHANLTDPHSLDVVDKPEAIVHCAAALPASLVDSSSQAETNRAIDDHVLGRAQEWRAAVVYTSGTSLYGRRKDSASSFSETDPVRALGPYLQEKTWAEDYGRQLSAEGGGAFTTLRISSPYGPEQRAQTVLRLFIQRALRGEPLLYWGDGTREQDFTYVDDVAFACACALRGPGGLFNIASGTPLSMRELALLVADITGVGPGAVMRDERSDPEEGQSARYDISAARRILQWSPRVSLREGLEHVVAQCRGVRR